jgi:hypothetical protein
VGYTRVGADRHRWADIAGSAGVAALSSWWLVEPRDAVPAVAWTRHSVSLAWRIPLQ